MNVELSLQDCDTELTTVGVCVPSSSCAPWLCARWEPSPEQLPASEEILSVAFCTAYSLLPLST